MSTARKSLFIYMLLGLIIAGSCTNSQAQSKLKKRIVVSIKKQKVYLWKGNKLVNSFKCSTGNQDTPTPLGYYTILKKFDNWVNRYPNGNPTDLGPVMDFKEGGWSFHGWMKDLKKTFGCSDKICLAEKS